MGRDELVKIKARRRLVVCAYVGATVPAASAAATTIASEIGALAIREARIRASFRP